MLLSRYAYKQGTTRPDEQCACLNHISTLHGKSGSTTICTLIFTGFSAHAFAEQQPSTNMLSVKIQILVDAYSRTTSNHTVQNVKLKYTNPVKDIVHLVKLQPKCQRTQQRRNICHSHKEQNEHYSITQVNHYCCNLKAKLTKPQHMLKQQCQMRVLSVVLQTIKNSLLLWSNVRSSTVVVYVYHQKGNLAKKQKHSSYTQHN